MTLRGWFLAAAVSCAGCASGPPQKEVTGPASAPGWEVRYNAVMALARRGSPKFLDPVAQDLMKEMLDEPQQLRNFRTQQPDGREVKDPQAARAAIIGAIKSVEDFHRQQPSTDLTGLKPALEKLASGQNRVVSAEAKTLLESLPK